MHRRKHSNFNTYGVESQKAPEFDGPVEVAKGDVHGNEDDIGLLKTKVHAANAIRRACLSSEGHCSDALYHE
jgi:hypothetical protein